MFRFLSFAFVSFGACLGLLLSSGVWVAGCGSSDADSTPGRSTDAGTIRRDAAPVDPKEAGPPQLDAGLDPPPSCAKYCDLVMANCTGKSAQYASSDECLAFCRHLPLVEPTRGADQKEAASVACRQYWADGPARTSPETYCLAAGPFGGNACGDRCTTFCTVLLSACSPDGGIIAYASQPECATACAGFSYRYDTADGGGEGPYGPQNGDTLNCRLYWLRAATNDPQKCTVLGPQSDVCKD
jgi:hypothetical protein